MRTVSRNSRYQVRARTAEPYERLTEDSSFSHRALSVEFIIDVSVVCMTVGCKDAMFDQGTCTQVITMSRNG
jgi:hypothetical protein